jgi:conjugal transfer mating pair stabilization protein TraG
MSDGFITIHVIAAGDLFADVLNAITAFMSQNDFFDLLRITAFIGIVMVTVGFLKSRDPMVFAKWFVGYVLCTNLLVIPKTNVLIDDISTLNKIQVGNVPVVFAVAASIFTSAGYGLALSYDMIFATPGDFEYTRTGALFGAKLIEAAHEFRILDPTLKEEMDHYFRSCVVGDIRINHKYSVGDLATSTNIWDVISKKASPLRMTVVNGALVTCEEASRASGLHSLKARLETEIHKAYSIFGINLFGKQKKTAYEDLFETNLTSAAKYYQGLTDTSSNIFLQSMMINAMRDGINHYQAFTDNTASVVNHEFTKAQVQDRWSWAIFGLKAVWFLPLLHTNFLLILFGVFPLVLALSTVPGGGRILIGYFQFFISLQCWPVLFAVINHVMTKYGMGAVSNYGAMTMVNLDKMTEQSQDISSVAGWIMIMIPFLAKGVVSNLGEAFNGLATSITSQAQGSATGAAAEAASASFGLGQTSFYNTTANNLSANKHDSNWTNMQGMSTEQLGSGVLKTITGSGDAVYDVSPGMSKGPVHINDTKALSGSLNKAYEESTQAANNESQHYQSALSNFAHNTVQLSKMKGHDLRLGNGVSESDSAQYSQALSTLTHIASDVAKRTGVTQEDALAHMTSAGINGHVGISSKDSVLGHVGKLAFGVSGGVDGHAKVERTSTSSDRYHEGTDHSVSAKEAEDFNQALNYVKNFAKTHHFDDSHSEGASLSNQLGADLRDAQTASHNYDASMSKASRISNARSYVESNSEQITTDLNQAFSGFIAHRLDEKARDELYAHPGDMASLNKLQALGTEFISEQRDGLIARYGTAGKQGTVEALYQKGAKDVHAKADALTANFQKNSKNVQSSGTVEGVGIDEMSVQSLKQEANHQVESYLNHTSARGVQLKTEYQQANSTTNKDMTQGKEKGQANVNLLTNVVPNTLMKRVELHDKSAKPKELIHD